MNKAKHVHPARGVLIIVSAPSGCGKTTIVERLLKRHPDWGRSISVTTREPRAGEKAGGDYYFVKQDAFRQMCEKGEFLESATVFGNSYGTPKQFVVERLNEGNHVILAIDVQGMLNIKKEHAKDMEMVTIFVLPPSIKILKERLEGRKTDSPEQIEKRLAMAQEEIKHAKFYDFTVMNQNLEQTVLEIERCIEQRDKQRRDKTNALHSS